MQRAVTRFFSPNEPFGVVKKIVETLNKIGGAFFAQKVGFAGQAGELTEGGLYIVFVLSITLLLSIATIPILQLYICMC